MPMRLTGPRRVVRARLAAAAVVAFVLAAIASRALALDIPPRPQARLSDFAGLIDPTARASLEADLTRFEGATSSQIAVAIFPSLEGESLEDFVNRVFETWKLGQAERDNGVLLAIFIGDRLARIEVGYGLEGALTDAVSSRILRERLTPAFREGRYAEGIASAVAAIEAATRGEFTAEAPSSERKDARAELLRAVFIFAIIVVFITISNRGGMGGGTTVIGRDGMRRVRRGGWGGGGPFIGGFGGGSGGGWGSGGGGFGGGGGFSGGGGSSGGGGASGSW
ncbi:MAG: TPM domain-containing protein [bacterium]